MKYKTEMEDRLIQMLCDYMVMHPAKTSAWKTEEIQLEERCRALIQDEPHA